MLLFWALVAQADPPAAGQAKAPEKPTVVIEVAPTVIEGSVKVAFPGFDGAKLFVDGWYAGDLPVQTDLAEGPHRFRVETSTTKQTIEAWVTPVPGSVMEIDLSAPPKPPAVQPIAQ
jgi:hypothetical protein